MSFRVLFAAAVLLPASITPAAAELNDVAKAGSWTAIAGTQSGHQYCAINSVSDTMGLLFLAVRDDYSGVVRLSFQKSGWAIPQNIKISVRVYFNDGYNVNFSGIGKDEYIKVYVPPAVVKPYLHSLTSGKSMSIQFPGGTESQWSFDLTGTTPTVTAMAKCITDSGMAGLPPPFTLSDSVPNAEIQPLGSPSGEQTQPFGRASTTQAVTSPTQDITNAGGALTAHPDQSQGSISLGENGPTQEAELISTVNQFTAAFDAASNDFAKGAQRQGRAKAICRVLSGKIVHNWTGHIKSLSSESSGKGILSINISENIAVETTNNSFSDIVNHTLIPANAPFYPELSRMHEGQEVTFSGVLFNSESDCITETSLTQAGSMRLPDFEIRFSDVKGR